MPDDRTRDRSGRRVRAPPARRHLVDRHRARLAARRRRRLRAPRRRRCRGNRDASGATSATSTSPGSGRAARSPNPTIPSSPTRNRRSRRSTTPASTVSASRTTATARDSVAMHRDREMRWLDDTVVAILTFGAQRPFLVQRAQHPRPFDRARPLPRGRRPDGVRRSVPGRLAARRAEDAPRGARPHLRAVALHDQARPARHATRLLRAPRVLEEGTPMSIPVELDELRDGRRRPGAVRVPPHRLRRRERARGRDHPGHRRRHRSRAKPATAAARTHAPGRTSRCSGRRPGPTTTRSSSTAAPRSTARR